MDMLLRFMNPVRTFITSHKTWSTNAILLAFGVSAAIGIVFGYYPARRAASLNPIEALRYDKKKPQQ